MRVVIVGGGIAGPVLGSFLARCGIESVICEGRPASADTEGAFLGVAPNGMNVLGALGLAAEIERLGHPCEGFEFQNARGERIGAIDGHDDAARYGARLVMLRRGVLHAALLEHALGRGVPVRWGARLAEIDRSDPTRAVARFEDGSEEAGELIVGCDGLRSRTRAIAFPDAPPPAYTGLLDFGGYAPATDALPLEVGRNVMVFGRRGFFGAFRTRDDGVWWFHNGGDAEPVRDLDPAARRARILACHDGDPAWVRELVESTPDILGPWPLHEVHAMSRWHDGRVGLIGDAAHATSPSAGQGASLAMEDAMMLARCLRDERDPERAFTRLVELRRARVAEIVEASRRNSSRKAMTNPVGLWLRDRALPLFLELGARAQQRAHGYRIDWDAPAAG